MRMMQYFSNCGIEKLYKRMKEILQVVNILIQQKIFLTDLNHLGATDFLTLRDPCLGRNPYFKNHCYTLYLSAGYFS